MKAKSISDFYDKVVHFNKYVLVGAGVDVTYEMDNGTEEVVSKLIPMRKYVKDRSKYMPHQGAKERERRHRQANKARS